MIQLTSHKKSSLDLQCILRSSGICGQQSRKKTHAVWRFYCTPLYKKLCKQSIPNKVETTNLSHLTGFFPLQVCGGHNIPRVLFGSLGCQSAECYAPMIQLTSHKKSSLDLQCILRSPGICSQQSSKALNVVRFCNVTRVGKSLSQVSDPLPQIFVRASRPFHMEERCEGSPHRLGILLPSLVVLLELRAILNPDVMACL